MKEHKHKETKIGKVQTECLSRQSKALMGIMGHGNAKKNRNPRRHLQLLPFRHLQSCSQIQELILFQGKTIKSQAVNEYNE
jgi:hypothetical protein